MTATVGLYTEQDFAERRNQAGFGLVELLVSSFILLVTAASVFRLLVEIQHKTAYQAEVQSVLENAQLAMQIVSRYVRQAGNDPLDIGFSGITIAGSSEIGISSDLTGSAAPGNPDRGDPDGDTLDSGEDVLIRYNSTTRSLEIVPNGGSAQVVAGYLSGLSFEYYDSEGKSAANGNAARKIRITILGTSSQPDPDTHQNYGVQFSSDIQVAI